MRQVGTLSNERAARQFAAWLVSQQISAHAEAENGGWVVWIRDEDHLPRAREGFAHFQANPNDAQYQDAERAAQALAREEEARRRQAQKNVVEMRGRWGNANPANGGVSRRSPLVLTLIALSALAAITTYDDTMAERSSRRAQDGKPRALGNVFRALLFVDPAEVVQEDGQLNVWASIAKGEVWRLVTPIFVHFGLMHILLNMIWLYSFGAQIEDRRGSLFFLFLVLALAICSNMGQAIELSLRNPLAIFGGMSGVGYGLFGFIAVKSKYDNRDGYYLSPGTAFMAMLWFLLCILSDIPPFSNLLGGSISGIANTAHAVGLVLGGLIAAAPLVVRKPA